MDNGLTFDISDDNQFRAYCVRQFGILAERTEGLKDIKRDVPILKQEVADLREDAKSDKFWDNVRGYSGIVGVALHIAAHKLGFKV